ncbi:MAG: ABC transporter ATP-binding protein [Sphingomonadaceae bacterium]
MLDSADLTLHRAGRPVLEGVSLALAPGRVTAILGPNGAGKSSLLLALAGLLAPAAGAVRFDGRPLDTLAPTERAQAIGLLPQRPELHWDIDVETLVGLGRLPHRGRGPATAADRAAIEAALDATDTLAFRHRPARQLSGGEQARVLLARVLAGQPRILLADEPLASLDPAFQLDMLKRLRAVADSGAAVALVLHDLTHAARIADEALLLAGGRAVAAGPASDVLAPAALSAAFGVAIAEVAGPDGARLLVPTSPAG